MNKVILIGCEEIGAMTRALAEFANEDRDRAVIVVGFINEMSPGEDGWAHIAPYGDYVGVAVFPDGKGGIKKELAIQRMDKQAVADMVNEYQESRKGIISKFFKARPIFNGHPDALGAGNKYPDRAPKGVFANLAQRENGMYGEPILFEEAERLVTGGKRYFSGRWDAFPTGETELRDGREYKIFRPAKFLSAGLTDKPNLPVEMMNSKDFDLAEAGALADAKTESKKMNKEKIIALLKKHGIELANDASDEQVEAGLSQLGTKAASAVTLSNEKETLTSTVTAKETEIGGLKTERENFKTSFANERKSRIDREIGMAIADTRITPPEKADWERRLGNESTFANELEALTKLTPKMKTSSITIDRGGRKVELSNSRERAEMVNEIIDEICREKGLNRKNGTQYTKAYNEAMRRHPALFEAMGKK